MPKQGGAKKKAKEEAKQKKAAEKKNRPKVDPTFGLKNKKGKKNREFVQNSIHNMTADEKRRQQDRQKKKEAKEQQEEAEYALEDLFRTVDGGSLAPSSKSARKPKKENQEADQKEEKEDKPLTLESIDPYSDDFEELLDKLRETLSNRTDLTPCTQENFQKWYTNWTAEREREREIKARKKLQKLGKKGLTGRELFSIDPNSFKDDEEAEIEYIFEKEEERKLREQQEQQSSLDKINEEGTLDNTDHKHETRTPEPGENTNDSTNTEQEPKQNTQEPQVKVDEELFMEELN